MISIVIRVLNEAKCLGTLLQAIRDQDAGGEAVEIVVVDSGSSDGTLEIAERHQTRILHIRKDEFSFGRSLNLGCEATRGDYLAFVSGHCIPCDSRWLDRLVAPVREGSAAYAYGRQVAGAASKFSEAQLFSKYFPPDAGLAQNGFFCNNASAALRRSVWSDYRFDEDLTGLEDMELAKRLLADGHQVTYVPDSVVYHLHDESWRQVRMRYEREAIALQRIMPEVHVFFGDFLRYLVTSIALDMKAAVAERKLLANFFDIAIFRLMQYWGTYRGNHMHRELSRSMKERYFYPSTRSASRP